MMGDAAVLRELEKRMRAWVEPYEGWDENNAGFDTALRWIADLRGGVESSDETYGALVREKKL